MPEPLINYDKMHEFDATYCRILKDIENFFRFETRNPDAYKFDDDYYERAAQVFKNRIDLEMKHRTILK